MPTAADFSTAVQQLYIAYFGRPADPLGLYNFQQALNAAGAPTTVAGLTAAYSTSSKVKALIDAFGTSDESKALYTGSTLDFVNAVYKNIFNRSADVEGLLFWANAIDHGGLSKGNAALSIMAGAMTNTSAQGLLDKAIVEAKVAVAANFTTTVNTPEEVLAYQGNAAAATARAMLATVTGETVVEEFQATIEATVTVLVTGAVPVPVAQTFNLTNGVDTFNGGKGADTFNATIGDLVTGGALVNAGTLSALDTLNGGEGADVLNVLDQAGGSAITGVNTSGIETVNVRSVGAVNVNTSVGFSGVTTLNVTQGTTAAITAAETTGVAVTGLSGNIGVTGGSTQEVSTSAAGATVTLSGAVGNIAVTSAKQTGAISVNGGANVAVTATSSASNGAITVGNTKAATGTVAITENLNSDGTAAFTGGATSVTGGTSVNVTVNGVSTAKDHTSNDDITMGAVSVTGNGKTTSVTVNQNKTVTAVTKAAVAAVKETSVVTFGAMTSGQTLSINGLTFTANKDLTAEQVAQAFANLELDDTHGTSTASGYYTGTFNTGAWTTAAASGKTVTFTAKDDDEADLVFGGTATAPTQAATAGTAAAAAIKSGNAVDFGAVTIVDAATAAIKTVTVNGYATGSTIGGAGTATTALESLTLANAATGASMTVADTADTLALNVEKMGSAAADAVVTLTAAPKTLNVKSTGANYVNLTAAATEALNVTGTGTLDIDATDLAALKTVKVSESAGLKLNAGVANTLTSVDTSATTGAVSATIDGSTTTYTGGAGKDSVTLATATALTKAINLGAGDDSLSFGALAVTGSSAALAGGDGTDTLSMTAAAADGLDGAPVTFYSGFERLTINAAYGDVDGVKDTLTLNMANLGFTNYVTTSGSAADGANTDVLVLDKMASGATIVLTAAGEVTVGVADAATGTADVLNAVVTGATAGVASTLTAANVESINVTATDSLLDDNGDGKDDAVVTHSMILNADKATTVTATGNANLTLDLTNSTKVTLIDGSAMTGVLTATSKNTTSATTIKGGAGDDVLSAATGTTADVLVGGAGDDTLHNNAGLSTLTGGAGADLFVISAAGTNVNSYNTITDLASGDGIQFTGADSFQAAKVALGDTAVFQDFANASVNAVGVNDVAWFQFGGNTYAVVDKGVNSTTFVNGEDLIVKITGQVDLSTAAFNATSGILVIG